MTSRPAPAGAVPAGSPLASAESVRSVVGTTQNVPAWRNTARVPGCGATAVKRPAWSTDVGRLIQAPLAGSREPSTSFGTSPPTAGGAASDGTNVKLSGAAADGEPGASGLVDVSTVHA